MSFSNTVVVAQDDNEPTFRHELDRKWDKV